MSVQVNLPDSATRPNQHNGARTTFASLAAIGSVLAASSCCLPVLPFMMAAGLAGSSTFLNAARPWLLVAAVLSIGFAFYQGRRAKKCRRRPSILSFALLWMSAALVTVSILFPEMMANFAAGLPAW